MGIFSSIMDKIFHHGGQDAPAPAPDPAPADAAPAAEAAPPPPPAPVDVAAVLDGIEDQRGEDLNWRTSIGDRMKLLDLDSSLQHRKDLAGELQYDGDTDDSASMNIWLHAQVMKKLAENGGVVPADLQG